MRGLVRWMVAVLITCPAIAVASEEPNASSAEVAIAEAALMRASTRRALWTSAEDALRRARRALQEGNAAMAIEQARIAQKQSELGIAQKDYPLFR